MKSYADFFDHYLIIESHEDLIQSIHLTFEEPKDLPKCSVTIQDVFDRYVQTPQLKSSLKLDVQGTEFQKKVIQALLDIPCGEVRTYQEIAQAIGHPKAYRAVGHACHINPFPILVPCHRVVAKGHLGGYAYGLAFKQRLLTHEKEVNTEV